MLKTGLKDYIKRILSFSILTVGFTLLISTQSISKIYAEDFDILRESQIEIDYSPEDDFATVTQTISYRINDPKYFYNSNTKFTILLQDYRATADKNERAFKKSTIKLSDSENESISNYEISEKEEGIEIKISRSRETTFDAPYKIVITYKTHELTSLKGNISSIYIPGVSDKQQFLNTENGITTKMDFIMKVYVPENAAIASEISPKSITEEFKNQKRIYTVNGKNLVGKMGWIQFGTKQYNYFKIVQNTPKTDYLIPTELNQITNLLSTNIYKIVLPREFEETNQKIYYSNITPKPTKIEIDNEGNLIAQFEVPANQNSQIVAEGIITMEKLPSGKKSIPNLSILEYLKIVNDSEITILDKNKYIQEDIYWQKNNKEIKNEADKLIADSDTIEELIRNNYNFVIEQLEYDYEKVNSENPRLGASLALSNGTGVCMEYADLLIAIFRAQGIPTRTAFGYGNDPLLSNLSDDTFNTSAVTNTRIGHQWVQVWLPEYGWLSVDPTWGETGREYIGPDLDHILWSTVSNLSESNVFDTYLFSANKVDSSILSSFDIELRTINQGEFTKQFEQGELNYLNDMISDDIYNNSNNSELNSNIKTTPLGKALVITLPSCIAIIFLVFLLTVFTHLLRRVFGKRDSLTQIKAPKQV
jgi:transglutaminase-like putative cysteine protease